MSDSLKHGFKLPPEQQAIRDKCFHPSGTFIEFKKEEIEQSIPERFERIVRKYPTRIAVKTKNNALTYVELDQATSRVAHRLIAERGVEKESVIALVDHDADAIATILGVFKTSKTCVPLDPVYHQMRSAYIVDDSQAQVIITKSKNLSLAHELAQGARQVINLDDISATVSVDSPGMLISPDTAAYILYTSGSTGEPKGVVQNHLNLLHDVMGFTNSFHICTDDRLTLFASASGGQGLKTILNALLNGAAICTWNTKEEGLVNLARWINGEEISIFNSGPTLLTSFMKTLGEKEHFPDLRLIVCTGEPASRARIEQYKKHFSSKTILVNMFGALEAGQIGLYAIDKETGISGEAVPVGYATQDKEVLLLNKAGKEVNFHEIGEIAVRSRYLTPGYWQRPDLTEAKLILDRGGDNKRVYLTGDLGLMLPDGCLMHKGRKDFRVKIRGYGVDITEVEEALREHAAIKDAVVVARETDAGEARLVAYFTCSDESSLSVSELRDWLRTKIPDYTIPSAFTRLDAMPLTPNGKVDRNVLPDPGNSRPDLEAPYVAPTTPAEQKLAQVWTDTLGVDQVGIHDNLFDLGGNSLLAVQIVSRVYDEFHIELPLRLMWEAPTVAALAQHIDTALRTVRDHGGPALKPAPRNARLPLSFAQQRLWFLNQLEPESPAYNESRAYRLRGVLDVAALQKALDQIVARHEVLRTNFVSVDGNPTQVIAETRSVQLPLIDLSAWPESGREAEARRLLAKNVRRPFDLSRDLMLRVMLLRLDEQEHILLVVNHHIASDGWSSGIFWQELADLYRSLISGGPCELAELPIQYADYAIWQRNRLQGDLLETQLSYWKKQLDGVEPLRLFTDRRRSATSTSPGAKQSLTLPNELSDGLKAVSRQQGATLFMTLLAAFQTLLNRYTGQTDIVVGTPIAGRTRLEVEKLIGFFVNTLVLRADCSNDPTFRELLDRVKQKAVDAYVHQEVPFEKLVEELKPERNLGSLPLFPVMFQLQNTPRSLVDLPGLTLSPVEVASGTAKFDLSLSMREEPDGLKATLEYSTELFDGATITRMFGHLQVLLEGIVADPDRSISALPILTQAERHQFLVEWNDTKREYPRDKCIHHLFEEQVAKTPDAVAVVFDGEQLTYGELNAKANQLAHHLRKLGVGPDVLVGLCVERSLEMIVGLLGILKAGGAYVPLDPAYPKERLAFMLEETQAPVLLTQCRLIENLPDSGAHVICLDRDWAEIARESEANLESGATADNLAYVIYTSGSTGKPKGVMIQHASLVNYLLGFNDHSLGQSLQTLPTTTKPTFDASLKQLFAPFLRGDRVWIIPEEVAQEPARVYQALASRAGVSLNCVGSFWHAILAVTNSSETLMPAIDMTALLLGGESISSQLVERTFSMFPRVTLWNLYGPTEATANATIGRIVRGGRITLGRPLPNVEIFILDSRMQPVPIGIPGELCIGGKCLARGYLNRPELTAEKFISHSFDGEPARRLYRTGDLARYLSDGNIEFLGRVDNQVKIRGYRIELGEIESVLGQHSCVGQSVVAVREDGPGDNRLVAYVVGQRDSQTDAHELRTFLRQKLPEYMVPSAFIFLDSLPLTPNGKVDRKGLPAPDGNRDELEQAYVAPRCPTEEILAGIWAEVLKLSRIGIYDNFFDLGGHSLLATQVISRVRQAFQMDLPLRSIFEKPTVEELAMVIMEKLSESGGGEAMPRILAEVESLSDEEVRCLIAEESGKLSRGDQRD